MSSREEAPETIELEVPGLERDAEIVVDHWGIPHIRAATRRDVFFVAGLQRGARPAVADRSVAQARARAAGRRFRAGLPGAGPRGAAVPLSRRHGGGMGAPTARRRPRASPRPSPPASTPIDLAGRQPACLPPEFSAMTAPTGTLAGRRTSCASAATRLCATSCRRSRAPSVAARAGLDADLARGARSRRQAGRAFPRGCDPADVPLDLLDVFMLATAAVTFSPERLAATLADGVDWSKVNDLGEVMRVLDPRDRTTGSSRPAAPRPGGRSSPAIRTAPMRCPRCATSSISRAGHRRDRRRRARHARASPSATTPTPPSA